MIICIVWEEIRRRKLFVYDGTYRRPYLLFWIPFLDDALRIIKVVTLHHHNNILEKERERRRIGKNKCIGAITTNGYRFFMAVVVALLMNTQTFTISCHEEGIVYGWEGTRVWIWYRFIKYEQSPSPYVTLVVPLVERAYEMLCYTGTQLV